MLQKHRFWFLRVIRHTYISTVIFSNFNSDIRFKLMFLKCMVVIGLIFFNLQKKNRKICAKNEITRIPIL